MVGGPLLVTGAAGYVGLAVCRAAALAGYQVVAAYHRSPGALPGVVWAPFELADPDAVRALVAGLCPAAIIHAAAAWTMPALAQATIVAGSAAIAEAAAAHGARLIHLSTDMVFDGRRPPYREPDPPAPLSPYGEAKAAAEAAVAARLDDCVIVRTSLVTCFDPPDPRSAEVLAALRGAGDLRLFTDEYRCPVCTSDLAAALVELIDQPYRGILHIAGPERLSRYALGRRIAAYYGLDAARPAHVYDPGIGPAAPCGLHARYQPGASPAKNTLEGPAVFTLTDFIPHMRRRRTSRMGAKDMDRPQ